MKIKLWGVRGSLPASMTNSEYRHKVEKLLAAAKSEDLQDKQSIEKFLDSQPFYLSNVYGGDTTCIEIRSDKNQTLFVIDAGTGLRRLGDFLMREEGFGKGGKEINLFMTHTHWDHMQGFPFFVPAYIPNNQIHFYAPYKNLQERFERQQLFENFPQSLDGMASKKIFHIISPEGSLSIDGVTISCHRLNHPGGSFAYRFMENNKIFIFATDAEFTMNQIDRMEEYLPFFDKADLLVLDAQYTLEEAFYKFDWGHTSVSMAVNLGVAWHIKKLVLTHHDPAYTDEKIYSIYEEAIEHRRLMGEPPLEIVSAVEGMEFIL